MFSRQRRENIASVPAGLFSPYGLKTHGLQVRFAHPPKCALTRFARQRRANPASVPVGLLARWAKRTASRFASLPLRLRPVRATPARGSAWLIFALRAQNAHAPGSLRSPSDFAPCGRGPPGVPAGLLARWAQNARPPGPLKRTLRIAPRAGVARPGFRPVYFRPAGLKRTCSRFAPGGRGFLSGADVENRPKRGILKLM